jgi:hypothetical protein
MDVRKLSGLVLLILIIFAGALLAMGGTAPSRPEAPHPQSDADALAHTRQWTSVFNGNKIACYVDQQNAHRWFIVLPTREQRTDGVGLVANDSPSDDAWNTYCSKQPVVGHW